MFVNQLNTTDVTVPVDFGATGLQLGNLPEDLFDIDERIALATFAALCVGANVRDGDRHLNSVETLALRNLALLAASRNVFLVKADFRDLDRDAAKCANAENHELVTWVRRAAYRHVADLGITGPEASPLRMTRRTEGLQHLEPCDGRGYGKMAESLDQMWFEERPVDNWSARRLITYAAVMAACKPRLCNPEVEACILLALYAAGARISLTADQFRTLRERAEYYIGRMQDPRYCGRNLAMATFILGQASLRAGNEDVLA